jgi:hypothetical protein
MSSKWVLVIISSLVIVVIGFFVTISYNRGFDFTNLVEKKKEKLDKNDWENIKAAKKGKALKVRWSQKYGIRRTEYCKAVFYNRKDGLIKLVAPWLDITIMKSNTYDIEYKIVSMDSIPKN